MTIAVASRPSSSGYWSPSASTSSTPISKRKRTSCAFDTDGSAPSQWSPSMMAASPSSSAMASPSSHAATDEVTPVKRSRTLAPTSPRILSTSPSNVPFSSAFRAPSTLRPPTIEEQQQWSSSSSQPTSSPPAGVYAAPASTWTKVTTDYGHAWERSACEDSMNEAGMALDDEDDDVGTPVAPRAKTTHLMAPSHQPEQTPSTSSIWSHIEGDSDTAADSDNLMFDPDTGRRGDSIAWDADILQLKVPTSAHAHPYSPSAIAESSRAQLGATYFDQAVWQANQDRVMYDGA